MAVDISSSKKKVCGEGHPVSVSLSCTSQPLVVNLALILHIVAWSWEMLEQIDWKVD